MVRPEVTAICGTDFSIVEGVTGLLFTRLAVLAGATAVVVTSRSDELLSQPDS